MTSIYDDDEAVHNIYYYIEFVVVVFLARIRLYIILGQVSCVWQQVNYKYNSAQRYLCILFAMSHHIINDQKKYKLSNKRKSSFFFLLSLSKTQSWLHYPAGQWRICQWNETHHNNNNNCLGALYIIVVVQLMFYWSFATAAAQQQTVVCFLWFTLFLKILNNL